MPYGIMQCRTALSARDQQFATTAPLKLLKPKLFFSLQNEKPPTVNMNKKTNTNARPFLASSAVAASRPEGIPFAAVEQTRNLARTDRYHGITFGNEVPVTLAPEGLTGAHQRRRVMRGSSSRSGGAQEEEAAYDAAERGVAPGARHRRRRVDRSSSGSGTRQEADRTMVTGRITTSLPTRFSVLRLDGSFQHVDLPDWSGYPIDVAPPTATHVARAEAERHAQMYQSLANLMVVEVSGAAQVAGASTGAPARSSRSRRERELAAELAQARSHLGRYQRAYPDAIFPPEASDEGEGEGSSEEAE